ncbi:hypothetical protein MRB53_012859 [Persea americana]|uniref:Uncharacterized protein n=1 Tax=Persea americana TaxID=3435 RepID=A0ACC2LYN3_PERAE|nr:hypothetical protein MRB53_012859 [Persea americana]
MPSFHDTHELIAAPDLDHIDAHEPLPPNDGYDRLKIPPPQYHIDNEPPPSKLNTDAHVSQPRHNDGPVSTALPDHDDNDGYQGMLPNNDTGQNNLSNWQQQLPSVAAVRVEGKRSANASAITLRSGKELKEPSKEVSQRAIEEEIEKEDAMPQLQATQPKDSSDTQPPAMVILPPFPSRFAKSKKEEHEKDILETFRKVEVNIPLLDAIKQIPRYAKFLKELCTTKRKLKGNEKIHVGENISAVLQKKLPPKCKDPDLIPGASIEIRMALEFQNEKVVFMKFLEDVLSFSEKSGSQRSEFVWASKRCFKVWPGPES